MSTTPIVPATADGIGDAAGALRRGLLVAMPTETVYGLAADACNARAVAKVFAVKGRPAINPLIAHVASLEQAQREGQFDQRAHALARAFWPGPLTLVVPAAAGGSVCELARAGLATIALRVPAHPVAQALLRAVDRPLAAPSANPSGRLSPTRAEHVVAELPDGLALVLDAGPCEAGIESTIVAVLPGQPVRLLRPGAIAREHIEAVVGRLDDGATPGVMAPGQLDSHYAPRAVLRLNAECARPGEVLLGFGPDAPPGAANLSPTGDSVEAAARLYQLLRELDAGGATAIAVMPVPDDGLGLAINDRLQRAAAPRHARAE